MAKQRWMGRFARWHIWLGWLIAVPLLLWTLSGLVMVAKPIEEVHGDQLRLPVAISPLPPSVAAQFSSATQIQEVRTFVQRGVPVALVTGMDGAVSRYDPASGDLLPDLSAADARRAVASEIRGGDKIVSLRAFAADAPPLDLRKPIPSWQATLADGTHVYLNRQSGEIEAVRTRWWRFYDFMWGLHIMDLQTREDSHNPFVIVFGVLALIGALLGSVLLFRRRKSRVGA